MENLSPHQQLIIESITSGQRQGYIIILAPGVEEAGPHSHPSIVIDVIGKMPIDEALGQLEIIKVRLIDGYMRNMAGKGEK